MEPVICLDDSNRPDAIPTNKWIKKGEIYHPVSLLKCNVQNGTLGYILQEIELGPESSPYKCFSIWRFRPLTEQEKETLREQEEIYI